MKIYILYLTLFILLAIIGIAVTFYFSFKNKITIAYEAINSADKIQWRGETIEYTTSKTLPVNRQNDSPDNQIPLLIIHGGGGGFDQGKFIAEAIFDNRYAWVAPSRFGYLGSSMPADANIPMQVDAYEALLDELQLEKVIVVGLSAGGPSALHFALLKPERCAGLVMLSAISITYPEYDAKGDSFKFIYKTDFRFYFISTAFKKKLMNLFGFTPELVNQLSPDQLALFDKLLETMLPAKPRIDGINYDTGQTLSSQQYALDKVNVPTLVVHAEDDSLIPYEHGLHSANIPNAKLLSFKKGGHMVFGFQKEAVKHEIDLLIEKLNQ